MSKDNSGDNVSKKLENDGWQVSGMEGFEKRGIETRPQPTTG